MAGAAHGVNFGRVHAIGDSITSGWEATYRGGYRGPLWDLLRADGFSVTPVGSRTVNGENLPAADRFHDGWDGWRSDELMAQMPTWLAASQADTVLLMAGANNWGEYGQPELTLQRTRDILATVYQVRPNAMVFMANIHDADPNGPTVPGYTIHANHVDTAVRAAVLEQQGLGRRQAVWRRGRENRGEAVRGRAERLAWDSTGLYAGGEGVLKAVNGRNHGCNLEERGNATSSSAGGEGLWPSGEQFRRPNCIGRRSR